jgi:Na+/melibiose symporter-like transporter
MANVVSDQLLQSEQTGLTSRGRWMVLIAAFLGWGFDGLEQGIFPLISNPALKDLLNNNTADVPKWAGYITAAWLLGAAVGGLTFGWLGDRIGRVRAMGLSILMYSAFTGLGYFVQSPVQFWCLRFIAALGMGGEWALGVALVMECWPEKHRPLLAGSIGTAANVGYLIIAIVGYVKPVTVESWRWIMLAGALPALLTFFIRLFVPESHRWQESVKRDRDAQPIREVFRGKLLSRTIMAIVFASIVLIGTWATVQQIPLWVDRAFNKTGDQPALKAIAAIASATGAVVGTFVAPLIGQLLGRRITFFCLCAASLTTCQILFRVQFEFGPLFVLMVFLVGGLTSSFFGWFPLYLPELFPTRVRATGQGICYNTGRIVAAVPVLGIGAITAFYGGDLAKMAAAVTFIYVLGMIFIWFAPETKGQPLPEDLDKTIDPAVDRGFPMD